MMMMDMSMYGTYGKPDSYSNYGYAGGHHHHHHQASMGHHYHHFHHHFQPSNSAAGHIGAGHASVSPSPEAIVPNPGHYYSGQASASYSSASSSSDNFLGIEASTATVTTSAGSTAMPVFLTP